MIKAICFDFFNTLAGYSPSREQLYVDVCAANGINLDPKILARKIYIADMYWRDENRKSPMEKKNKLLQFLFYIKYISRVLQESGVKANSILAVKILLRMKQIKWEFVNFNDSIPTLKSLKEKGYKLGLISNVDKNIETTYKSLGILDYLDFNVTSGEAGCEKPDPGIFQTALAKGNISAEETLFVGDQYDLDIVGARNAGIKAILIDRNDWFDDINDCPRIKSLSQIKEYLKTP
jgi:putative hydrolase of the HAD superfamily